MAIRGAWARTAMVTYSGERVWGTGVHPIHGVYGAGDPRWEIREKDLEHTPPHNAQVDPTRDRELWGYTSEDRPFAGIEYDARPPWDATTTQFRDRNAVMHPAWNTPQSVNEDFREYRGGAQRVNENQVDSVPSETVTEGWRNKVAGNVVAEPKPSDPSQYERQTAMQQRFQTRTNHNAVTRGTDAEREPIKSRVVPQKIKLWSGGERHYDMFPKQQDEIIRPFWYRTAGTGDPEMMTSNQQHPRMPIQRTPSPDPALGPTEEQIGGQYGYQPGDYYA